MGLAITGAGYGEDLCNSRYGYRAWTWEARAPGYGYRAKPRKGSYFPAFLNRPLEGGWPFVCLDATYIRTAFAQKSEAVAKLVKPEDIEPLPLAAD